MGYKNIYKRLVKSYSKYSANKGQFVQYPPLNNDAHIITFNIEDFDDTVYLPFEEFDIPCPSGYKRLLSKMYGTDYMIPPPAEKRSHYHGEYIDVHRSYKDVLQLEKKELIKLIDNNEN